MQLKAIQELRQQGLSYQQIGDKFGVTRQRIHQKLKNYHTISHKGKKSKRITALMAQDCKICGKKPQNIHHIDGNTSNNATANLMPLCIADHYALHTRIAPKTLFVCKECGSSRMADPRKYNNDVCKACRHLILVRKKTGVQQPQIRKHERLPECVYCDKPFTELKPYGLNNMHRSCFSIFRYHTNPTYRDSLHQYGKVWKKENLQRAKEIQAKASHNFHLNHKEWISETAKQKRISSNLLQGIDNI